MPTKLKTTQIAAAREGLRARQGNLCALCGLPLTQAGAVLDHDHSTGIVRGALHRGCNALLGKVENNYKRYGVPSLAAFAQGVAGYLQSHAIDRTGLVHPTHKTEDEKRERRNLLARKRRVTSKAAG